MLSLTPEQIEYKEATLNQLRINQSILEDRLNQETRPEVINSIEEQLQDVEAHISRLQDELAGNVVFDEPVADELFVQAAKALAKEKFFLAKKHIHRLETIEPFYPGLERMKQEADEERASRRTRSIAQGTATNYPGVAAIPSPLRPIAGVPGSAAVAAPKINTNGDEPAGILAGLFQFHIIASCLVVLLLLCVMFGVFGVTIFGWLIEGG